MISSELNSNVINLASTLTAQQATAAELVSVLRLKQRILVEHRLGELQACAEREQSLASRLALLESEREDHTQAVAISLAGPGGLPAKLTMQELIAFLPTGVERSLLEDTSAQLQTELSTLAKLNSDNCMLTKNLIDYTSMVVRLLTQGTNHPAYCATGRLNDAPGAGTALLDNRI